MVRIVLNHVRVVLGRRCLAAAWLVVVLAAGGTGGGYPSAEDRSAGTQGPPPALAVAQAWNLEQVRPPAVARASSPREDRQLAVAESPNLIQNGQFEDGLAHWNAGSYHADPSLDDGTEEIVTEGCYSGKCLKLTHGHSTWQGASQAVGELEPGTTYVLRARFKTSPTHYGHTNLHDPQWRDGSCQVVRRSITRLMQGTGGWAELVQVIRLPERDDCGPLEGHNWRVYLYSYSPTSDPSPVYYDDIRLYQVADWPLGELEEDPLLGSVTCQLFSDGYPLVPCHEGVAIRQEGGRAGGQELVLTGSREKRETYQVDIPVRPDTLYRIQVWLRIQDRVVFNYLNLDYPTGWTRQREGLRDTVDLTKGIWSGLYSVTVDGVSILPPIIKDSPYRSPSDVDWFHEVAYFRTGPSQPVARIQVQLSGFEGKLHVDGLVVTPADSFIDDRYLHVPLTSTFQGMAIRQVTSTPLAVTTNAARYVFSEDTIRCYQEGQVVATITFDAPVLAGLEPVTEPGNVFLANSALKLSIGADSVLVVKLHRPVRVSVSGPRPGYHTFEAGVLFATDYRRGILFAPLRPPTAVRSMPSQFDARLRVTNYSDGEFAARGLKFWQLLRGFEEESWRVDYELAAGAGFVAQVFPPKEFDPVKYCAERMHTMSTNTVASPQADFAYHLQKVGAQINIGLVWMSSYAASENDLDPPEEYCRDAAGLLVHCDSPEVASRHPVGTKFDVTGPYRVAEPEAFRRLVEQAHGQGMRVIVYMSPQYYYTTDVDRFLGDLKAMVDEYGIDGVYYDGLYTGRPLKSLELVRKTRNLLGDRFYAQHSSWVNTLIRRSHRFRVPFLDAQADLLWLGEGVKVVDQDTWRLNFCGRNVSNTVSMLLGELRPVDYSADAATSIALSLSPEEQIQRTLACRGLFRTSPYSEISRISDKHFQTSIPFESRAFLAPYNRYCQGVTCGNGRCDVGESILDCPGDCAPPEVGGWLERRGGEWYCAAGEGVAQWVLDGEPLYALHYPFDGPLARDVSGHKQHPAPEIGARRQAPQPVVTDGRRAFRFDGSSYLYGDAGAVLELTDRPFSVLAALRPVSQDRQVLLSLDVEGNFYLGLEEGRFTAWVRDGDKQYGREEIVSQGCFAGRCVWAQHNDATWQGISQVVGRLMPGAAYELVAMFRTSSSHRGYVNLYDRSWKRAGCQSTGKSFTALGAGNGEWQPITVTVQVPMRDDCGESTADDEWSVYLYAHDPVADNSPILYDDVRLSRTDEPAQNLVENPGFEQGLEGWRHSSYIAPEVITTTTAIADDTWHTVGLTYDPPAMQLYVDGRQENAVRIRLRPFPRFGRWTIGSRRYTGSADNFVGLLDDLLVARRALTLRQVAEYHGSGLRRLEYAGQAGCIYLRQGEAHTAVRGGRVWLPLCHSIAPAPRSRHRPRACTGGVGFCSQGD